ncbi:Helix-turn-helix domain-containing protein [Paenibacillus sp. UNC496MF]|uniref:helix-turn-helix domain-containing protein n=1 Tax=Paenibacillus sp. UNC496MF TaxID=1502753 RepID=UPI0008E3919D|nr:helix-turn-helix domain-containing protein [Paenibacillus sp. UNC496MF]SFJ49235.1 Helix-turn-helix domain-containing protein [Paenibacillus sp. UNC496MF]
MDTKKWYKRLLFSHFAILFIAGAVISGGVYAVTYANAAADMKKSNRAYAERVQDGMTSSLKDIELMLANQLVNNEAIDGFFNDPSGSSKLAAYQASGQIAKIRNNPLIHSVYFYRQRDRTVLTGGYRQALDDFPDKPFLLELEGKPRADHWSAVRTYSEFPLIDPPERIISIVKNAPHNQGLVVLNVKADALLAAAAKQRSGTPNYMDIADGDGQPLYSTGPPASIRSGTLTRLRSDYIGWRFASGTAGVNLAAQAARRALLPLAVILSGLAAIVAFILYMTRRNYRPIERMVRRVSTYGGERGEAAGDEFMLIESAFDTMLSRMALIDRQQAEKNAIAARGRLFAELQDGGQGPSAEEWAEYARLLGLPEDPRGIAVAIAEIDKYVPRMRQNRQALLDDKRRLEAEALRAAHEAACVLGLEWISGDRLAILIREAPSPSPPGELPPVRGMLDELRMRAGRELAFTVTIGLGSAAADVAGVKASFSEALSALQYKMTAGNDRLLLYREIRDKEHRVDSNCFRWLEDMVHHFRIPSPAWEADFARIFDHLEKRVLRNEELQLLLNYLTHRFAREMEEISPEINEYWHGVTMPSLAEALRESWTMREIRERYGALLRELYGRYAAILEAGSPFHLIFDVKTYIEANFANPDLSLNHISDRFGISGKYVSQLFKDRFDVKFVDFLIGLRVRQAQALLLETETSIHEIARQVGYEHAISFGRIFKKTVGVSPGDYRRQMLRGRIGHEC